MDEKEKQTLIDFYRQNYEFYGDSIQAVAWYTKDTQRKRFDALVSFWDIRNCSILDVGSGLGDFWAYLKENEILVKYTGIDIYKEFVDRSKYKYIGQAEFILKDINEVTDNYDYIFASGTFNHKHEHNETYIRETIKNMYKLSRKGLAFNLLSLYTPPNMKDNSMFYYYDPDKIFEFCKSLTENVKLKHDYLPNDFTIALSKV